MKSEMLAKCQWLGAQAVEGYLSEASGSVTQLKRHQSYQVERFTSALASQGFQPFGAVFLLQLTPGRYLSAKWKSGEKIQIANRS